MINLLKKKFQEEEISNLYDCEAVGITKQQLKVDKNYKFNLNTEDEILQVLNYTRENKEVNKANILDFRFFDNEISGSTLLAIVHHSNPNKNILKLLSHLKCNFIQDDSTECEEEFFNRLEYKIKALAENLKSSYSLNINFKKTKVIVYLDFEVIGIQVFLILSFLSKITKLNLPVDIIILTDDSLTFPLKSGMNNIYLCDNLFTKKGVGLLPTEQSIISTKGFLWDVSHWETNFGHANVTTSNEIEEDECCVYVEQGNVIFTAEIYPNK